MLSTSDGGYTTTTYKIKLYTRHMDWLWKTKIRYNEVLGFYHHLLLSQAELLTLSNQNLLRQLEILTVGEKRKSGKQASIPLPYEKTPLYFRRAAINAAIAMVRSEESRGQKTCAGKMNASPVYYQGMYKEFENGRILLKLWTGKSWVWVKYRYQMNRVIPENARVLSPSLKVNRKTAMLHVPVMEPVEDIRTVKERMEQKEKVCAVAFPNNKNLAVCVSLDSDGRQTHACFIKGGGELKHRRKRYLGWSRKYSSVGKYGTESFGDRKNSAETEDRPGLNKRMKEKIRRLTDYYAHKTSREIINYCMHHEIKIIVVPKYGDSLHLNQKGYLAARDYDWIGRRIIRYLKYKAFQAGIVVTEAPPHHSASRCYRCGSRIKKYNEGREANVNYYGGRLYRCPEGHRGNTAFNSARNLLKYFEEKLVYEYVS